VEGGPLELLGLLADTSRLRVFAAVVLGARQTADISAQAGLPLKETLKILTRLESGGVVRRAGEGWAAVPERFREAMAAASPAPPEDAAEAGWPDLVDPADAAVLRVFFHQGRLTRIPAQHGKRMVVLDHIARVFEPGVRYSEPEVNDALIRFHPDYAALRRYLVDAGFLGRSGGEYWRTGGTFLV
jgi:hypothetical protein